MLYLHPCNVAHDCGHRQGKKGVLQLTFSDFFFSADSLSDPGAPLCPVRVDFIHVLELFSGIFTGGGCAVTAEQHVDSTQTTDC